MKRALQRIRLSQLHRDANRAARKRVVMDRAAELLAGLPEAERKRLSPSLKSLVDKGAGR